MRVNGLNNGNVDWRRRAGAVDLGVRHVDGRIGLLKLRQG